MDRTFHRHISLVDGSFMVILGLLVLYCFWTPTTVRVLLGLALVVLLVRTVHVLIHTTYTFVGRSLKVGQGRFGRHYTLSVDTILVAERRCAVFGLLPYVLIEFGREGQFLSVYPENAASFLEEIEKRQSEKWIAD